MGAVTHGMCYFNSDSLLCESWAQLVSHDGLQELSGFLVFFRAAKVILKSYDDLRVRQGRAASVAASSAASSQEALRAKWRTVQHMHRKQMEASADVKGKSTAALPNSTAKPNQGAEVVEQGDTNTCPICLDECAARTVTACGHYFCW